MSASPLVSITRLAELPGLEVVAGSSVAADITAHAHGAMVVGLCLTGGRRMVCGGGQWCIKAGEGFIVPAGVRHACSPQDAAGHSYLALALRPEALLRAGVAAGAPEVWVRPWRDAGAAGLTRQAAEAILAGETGLALAALAALAACLGLHPGEAPPLHPATRRVRAAIDVDPAARHSLPALAQLAGVGPTYLERVFGRDTGMSVGQYLLDRRVKRAAACIAGGEPLADAALAAGFYDQSHLTRHFRRRMGVAPGGYRETGG
ncbi:helix-turn-helix domain-containing protein [Desulfovibrio aerotolerans]|uniref:Helix-turn-helix domain-containing protein n=1 Tax=Solidesulfovibrio aerotolerans TaxID=295255 RepID=A0A7C9IVD2_9BACT|nr:AraC family transcriptional regulator [Solidesulfovibrio aerotolerans]MYL84700.1 helix-turn-helix domain-containing protein [Solidesulfovibrio aerotolerans]